MADDTARDGRGPRELRQDGSHGLLARAPGTTPDLLGLCSGRPGSSPEVKQAVAETHSAGMRVVMMHGVHRHRGHRQGAGHHRRPLARPLLVPSLTACLTRSLRTSPSTVYARVSEHKTRIVDTWKKLGKVVAMTGDGVRRPSIHQARRHWRVGIRASPALTSPERSRHGLADSN